MVPNIQFDCSPERLDNGEQNLETEFKFFSTVKLNLSYSFAPHNYIEKAGTKENCS
jgi:hypothetical protein